MLLDAALRLADRGFSVFPIVAGQKSPPAISQWPDRATNEPYEIYELWQEYPNANIGIATGKYGCGALIAVDVDVKGGRDGEWSMLELQLLGFDFPETYTQTTPTGGRHLVYASPIAVRNGVNTLGDGIDIRSAGGYLVGAGSVVAGKGYTGNDAPVGPAPAWLIERLRDTAPAIPKTSPPSFVDRAQAIARGTAYLRTVAPAVQGEGGDHHTFGVAARCKDFGLSEADTFDLMMELWNPRCEPPWSPAQLSIKILNAYKYGSLPVGAIAPENDFDAIEEDEEEAPPVVVDAEGPVERLNKEYGHCISGGNQCILWETTDEHGKACTKYLSVEAFRGRMAPHKLQTAEGNYVPLAKVWFDSPKRKTYDGVVFDPSMKAPARFYNMWKGFSYAPAETGSHPAVDMFLDHALHNVCGGDKELCNWLLGYFAHMIQKPWEKPNVAIVFKGDKGVGKNALIERVGALMADNFLVAADKRYLTGNFNSHLERLLLFALDEAFWSGDKQAEGTLKNLITGAKHVIERKGDEPYTVANKTRICIIGNEEWIVPASADERRFAVFHVGDGRKQDTEFFRLMRVGMEEGGYPHLLTYLQNYPITTDVNVAPNTQALSDQKHASLEPVHQWWWDSLTDGVLLGSDFQTWPEVLDCETVRNAYRRYAQQRRITARAPTDRAFNKLLGKCAPSCTRGRSTTVLEGGARPYVVRFSDLERARSDWEHFIGHAVNWGEGGA